MMKDYSSTIAIALAASFTLFLGTQAKVMAEETLRLQGIVRLREVPGELDTAIYDQAIQKLAHKAKLSQAQYRSLGVGCIGLEWSYPSVGRPKVTAVYKGSPAEKAGIRLGEEIYQEIELREAGEKSQTNLQSQTNERIQSGSDTKGTSNQGKERPKDPTPAHFTLMREGTEQEVTVVRNGQPVKFILHRMNIADLPDKQARLKWQKVISSIGVPQDGFYAGRDLHSLKLTQAAAPVNY